MANNIKITLLLLLATIFVSAQQTIHGFAAKSIKGEQIDFSKFEGKKLLIVNTASKCGLTPQYEGLQSLYEKYKDQNFEIIGFPANNFLSQEPGTNCQIEEFCQKNYDVTFQMMGKISVKGDDLHPIYDWLTSKEKNGVMDSKVSWNFQKYLIDEEGKLIGFLSPKEAPDSEKLIDWIENGTWK